MTMTTTNTFAAGLALTLLAVAVAGATEGDQASTKGQNKDVDIRIPTGKLTMTNNPDAHAIEMALYPSARLRPASSADRNSSDVNLNVVSSLFGLKLVVQRYDSDDTMDQIVRFYETDLATRGAVVTSGAGSATGSDEEKYEQQLKVGSDTDFRLVAVKSQGTGSSFALVRVKVGAK